MKRGIKLSYLILIFATTLSIVLLYLHAVYEATHGQLRPYILVEPTSSAKSNGDGSLPCSHFPTDMSLYPFCFEKMNWLQKRWKSHSCYASLGVDGSLCSFRNYLSLVENHCPPTDSFQKYATTQKDAEINTELDRLFSLLRGRAHNYDYIKDRLKFYWSNWKEALPKTVARYPNSMSNRKRLNIIVHMGFLTEESLNFAASSKKGGPLGEFLQWSDLIACLFLLGHNLYISANGTTLLRNFDEFGLNSPCPLQNSSMQLDLIITDILGLKSFRETPYLDRYKCRIRLLDSFGTHVEFNKMSYFNSHQNVFANKGTMSRNSWGGHELQLLQYWTFFPHTPDNGFLGFAIHSSNAKPLFRRGSLSRPTSLIYGKKKDIWDRCEKVIEVLKNLTEVHATIADLNDTKSPMFSTVINHGFLNVSEMASLLRSVDIFVGLGFPYEGPAPLEAIAHGAVFINPKFNPPRSRLNTAFFSEKPTLRELTSQSPYMEQLGKPYVYTVDINDKLALKEAIKSALNEKPKPFVPEEFTLEGMLIRVNMLISRDLCSPKSTWPPTTSLQPVLGAPEQSCERNCELASLVCEPSFFPLINSKNILKSIANCPSGSIRNSTEPLAPYNCSLQSDPSMFSCASRPRRGSRVVRICPCRDYLPGQNALCKDCLS